MRYVSCLVNGPCRGYRETIRVAWNFNENCSYLLTSVCTEGNCLCNLMCSVLFNILNITDLPSTRVYTSIMQYSVCWSVPNYFYCGVGAAKYGVWLTDSFFLIFGRGHIQLTPAPPLAHAPPRPASPAAVAALQCVADLRWFKDPQCIQLKEKILQWYQWLRRYWILIKNRLTPLKMVIKSNDFKA